MRWAVRASLVLGIAASVAANVLHALPNPIAQTISAWPPLALLLTVELIARVPVHRRALAAVRIVATIAISGIAAYVSYVHMAGVAARYGETGAAPYLIPLSVDGLVVVASVCLVELAAQIRAATLPPAEPTVEPVKPVGAPEPSGQLTAGATRGQTDIVVELLDPSEWYPVPPRPPVDPRARALAALALKDANVVQIAADAGVTVETVQRWVRDAAARTARPRGGPRNPAPPAAQSQEPELVGAPPS